MNKQQTAVEWLVKEIMKHDKSFTEYYGAEIEQANKMFEQQMINFTDKYILECLSCNYDGDPISLKETEQYYKENFDK